MPCLRSLRGSPTQAWLSRSSSSGYNFSAGSAIGNRLRSWLVECSSLSRWSAGCSSLRRWSTVWASLRRRCLIKAGLRSWCLIRASLRRWSIIIIIIQARFAVRFDRTALRFRFAVRSRETRSGQRSTVRSWSRRCLWCGLCGEFLGSGLGLRTSRWGLWTCSLGLWTRMPD